MNYNKNKNISSKAYTLSDYAKAGMYGLGLAGLGYGAYKGYELGKGIYETGKNIGKGIYEFGKAASDVYDNALHNMIVERAIKESQGIYTIPGGFPGASTNVGFF